ncbi:PilZ domain-containing protein [Sphingomonas sp. MMS12-HWE2-04]|uniref:PilZ domain-containing protein n=1 Tax=Sphingomonas sp. MMS12-HWE2-04 TaxID=3234199 RepID=UPI00384C1726
MNAVPKHQMFARPQTSGDRRAGDRRPVAEPSTLRGPDDAPIDVTVGDLSVSGFNVVSETPLPMGAVVQLGLPGSGRFAARVVRQEGDRYGCEFFEYLSDAAVSGAFENANVAQLFIAASDWHGAEPEIQKWPAAARVSIAVGGALAFWGGVLWLLLR